MPSPVRWERLDSYFSSECTAEEAREIEQWIDAVPERRQRIEALRTIWTHAGGRPDRRWDALAAWQRLAPTLEVPAVGVGAHRRLAVIPGLVGDRAVATHRRRTVRVLRVAAAVALVLGGAALWRLAISERFATTRAQVASVRVYGAPRGQRGSITLADGTRIVLAPGSTLRAARDFVQAPRRDVYLEGEALFEVTHDASRPFVVHAAQGTAEDLGTRFVVTAYRGDTAMRVVVAEGVVAIRGLADSTATPPTLHAGDLATVNHAGRIAIAHDVAIGEYLSWTAGQLVFRGVSVRDAAAVLARWYDVDIHITPAAAATAAARRVTLTTEPGQPLAEVLTALTVPSGLWVRWVNGTAVIDS